MNTSKTQTPINTAHNLDQAVKALLLQTMAVAKAAAWLGKIAEHQDGGKIQTETFAEDQSPAYPALDHRFSLCAGPLTEANAIGVVTDMAHTVIGVLTLLKLQLGNHPDGRRLDDETAYYGFHSVRKELGDIDAALSIFPAGHIVDTITKANLSRAEGIISLLCDRFAEDDEGRTNNGHIGSSIDSVIKEIEEIRDAVNDFHQTGKTEAGAIGQA